jgi:hypothetical protein
MNQIMFKSLKSDDLVLHIKFCSSSAEAETVGITSEITVSI